MTIIRKGSKAINEDYKSYDRYIKPNANVTINPGKTKRIKFYVSGSNTWPDVDSFEIRSKLIYDGVTREWFVSGTLSEFKLNNKWHLSDWKWYDALEK